jgi:hypothetical protein
MPIVKKGVPFLYTGTLPGCGQYKITLISWHTWANDSPGRREIARGGGQDKAILPRQPVMVGRTEEQDGERFGILFPLLKSN